jgi:hypothetical protein
MGPYAQPEMRARVTGPNGIMVAQKFVTFFYEKNTSDINI